jgi:beta-glucanase (GH16 family)
MVAALLPKAPDTGREGQTYGRYAVRFKADPIDGYKMAWLLWPDSGRWPRDGEIDFPERDLSSTTVSGFVHHQGARRGSDQASVKVEYDSSAWHTAVIEWSPDLVVFTLDGVEIGRTTERIPSKPMHWVLQTETMLTSKRPPKDAAGNVQIDWVAVWQYDPTAVAPPPVTAATPAASTTTSPPTQPTRPTFVRYRVIRS